MPGPRSRPLRCSTCISTLISRDGPLPVSLEDHARKISIAEMRTSRSSPTRKTVPAGRRGHGTPRPHRQVSDVKEMLRMAMLLEQSTIEAQRSLAHRLGEHGRPYNAQRCFRDIIVEVEQHSDTFRTELETCSSTDGSTRAAIAAGCKHYVDEFNHSGGGEIAGSRGGKHLTQNTESFCRGPVFRVFFVPDQSREPLPNPAGR